MVTSDLRFSNLTELDSTWDICADMFSNKTGELENYIVAYYARSDVIDDSDVEDLPEVATVAVAVDAISPPCRHRRVQSSTPTLPPLISAPMTRVYGRQHSDTSKR